MEGLLEFYKDLIVFTAGTAILLVWITLFVALAIEIYDNFKETSEED